MLLVKCNGLFFFVYEWNLCGVFLLLYDFWVEFKLKFIFNKGICVVESDVILLVYSCYDF